MEEDRQTDTRRLALLHVDSIQWPLEFGHDAAGQSAAGSEEHDEDLPLMSPAEPLAARLEWIIFKKCCFL